MSATDPQEVVFWPTDAGLRLFFAGHWYVFVKYSPKPEPRWIYRPEEAE